MPDLPNPLAKLHTTGKKTGIVCIAFSGALSGWVNDGPVMVCKAGESFSELPGDHHGMSANARDTASAKLLVVFVVDSEGTDLTVPIAQ